MSLDDILLQPSLSARSDLSREGLARILSAGGIQVAGSASRVSELVQNSIRPDQPLLLIIDVGAIWRPQSKKSKSQSRSAQPLALQFWRVAMISAI